MTSAWDYDDPAYGFKEPLSPHDKWYRDATGTVLGLATIVYFMLTFIAIDFPVLLPIPIVVLILCGLGTYEAWQQEGHDRQMLAIAALWGVGILTGPVFVVAAAIMACIYIFTKSTETSKGEYRQFLLFLFSSIGIVFVILGVTWLFGSTM
jgi:hypothetical protein